MLNHRARKRFGQNFLHDQNIIQKIVKAIAPQKTDHMLEIGPGQGALTAALLPYLETFHAIEIDRDLIAYLQENFAGLQLHVGDALNFQLTELSTTPQQWRVVGNLPYNISTPLIFHLLDQLNLIKDMHFMLQKEVVERMTALAGEPNYGRLSVMVQYFCEAHYLFTVKPSAFKPVPAVDSAIVRLIPHRVLKEPAKDIKIFSKIVEAAFNQRRKTLRNSLKGWLTAEDWVAVGIDPQLRPEVLRVEEFLRLANRVYSSRSILP